MTTIAWDGKSISADTQSTSGSTVLPCPTKLIVIREHLEIEGKKIFLVATAGTSGDHRHSLKYIRDGGLESGKEMHKQVSSILLMITTDGCGYVFQKDRDNLLPCVWEQPAPYATGSGGDFALAAMHCGKNSHEAVQIASLLDVYTGGKIDTIMLQE
jgi:ATP-dependent protease HslVU (ClpYQ) peptidase subunit